MIQDMNKTLTRLFTVALLMMVSLGAGAQYVSVNIEKGGDFGNGSITEKRGAPSQKVPTANSLPSLSSLNLSPVTRLTLRPSKSTKPYPPKPSILTAPVPTMLPLASVWT